MLKFIFWARVIKQCCLVVITRNNHQLQGKRRNMKQQNILLRRIYKSESYLNIILERLQTIFNRSINRRHCKQFVFCCVALLQQLSQRMHGNFSSKRLNNTEILAKTQMAIQAIKRQDMMQQCNRLNLQSNYFNPSKNLLNDLDNDYSKLTPHKIINLDSVYKISLFTYSQQFYNLEMMNYIFPMRVAITNVKNQGTIYIGYDQQYPGIYQNHQIPIFSNQSLENTQNYDFKLAVNQDIMIVLKNKGSKVVKNVYFTIKAGKSLFICDFKVDYFGLKRDQRVNSQAILKTRQHFPLKNDKHKTQVSTPTFQKSKNQINQSVSKFKQLVHSKISSRQNMQRTAKLLQMNVINRGQTKRYKSKVNIEQNLSKRPNHDITDFFNKKELIKNIKKRVNSTGSFSNFKKPVKTEVDYKLDEAKRNKDMLEQYKLKDKELRETASKCKKMIENYKKIFNEENVRKRKLNKDLVVCLYSSIFIRHVHKITDYQIRKEKNMFRIDYLCTKFIKKLKKSYNNTCSTLYYRSKRLLNEGSSGIYFLTKMIAKQSTVRAEKVVKQTFMFLQPFLLVRHSFSIATKYRTSVKLIQKLWKIRYHNRLQSLLYFVERHLLKMFKQFPHLGMLNDAFHYSKTNRSICLTYIKDESQKYRLIYQAYLHRLQEINQMTAANQSMKKKIKVPRKPNRPLHRFFRNVDILKSMVRTWFQIEYKKYLKKSAKTIHL